MRGLFSSQLRSAVAFRAMSKSGVVIAEEIVDYRLESAPSQAVSATIAGLSEPEIERVAAVRVEWQYSR